ncbi:hypothetical protein L1987_86660 [Smallanthus sonchifolius]|uniref:Uncharacterized protein n=1 Tax=Smallanthus sonchifolius TaxID=185202 RepID=A0ACB8XZC8_9ASTR|nr:hypothetical protein L1987_86660 [Smallanthus sonchifolius]
MIPIKETNSSFILPDQTCQRLTLAQIELATHKFDEALVIGSGGFGKVYKSLTKFGSVNEVAIKRLHSTSTQGADEFEAEVKILSKLRHGNLVPLIGYCNEGKEMVLAYEFMPNGTLEDHLHRGVTELSWLQRLRICIGAARGLDYLHAGTSTQHGVIHRDVKTSNILLDSNFAAKISDFGLAKVGTINQTRTHVSTLVKGTFGYMDPCYFHSGQLTRKSDVYAFGVVLFELLSGKQAVDPTLDEDQWSLAVWAKDHFKEGRLNEIINHRLMGQISKKCLKEFTSLAAHCLHSQPKQRPTMAEVVVKLESIMSRERGNIGSGVDDGRFFNKVRYFFTSKADLKPAHAEGNKADLMPTHAEGSQSEISAEYLQKSYNPSIRTFTYAELVSATNNFNDEESSTCSHETIYKGWVDELTYAPTKPGVGLAMYVRTRHIGTSKLDLKPEEYNHPNLIKLLGYCLNKQELSCVYELTPDMSLDKLLFEERGRTSLSWVARLKIADYNARLQDFEVDKSFVAHGSYSFEMDAHYAAPEWFRYQADVKLEGFGVQSEIFSFGVVLLELLTGMKVFDRKRREGKQNLVKWATPLLAHVANLRMILDPQLLDNNHPPKGAYNGQLTRKSDVYAFGVVLFEVLSGKKAVDPTLDEDQWSLAVWVKHHFKQGRLNEIIDHRLRGQISKYCLKEFANMAVLCLHDQPKQRPTMAEVVVKLESIMSRERGNIGSGVDDGRFFNKVRYFFTSKADLKPAHAEGNKADLMPTHAEGSQSEISAEYLQKSYNPSIRTFTYDELVNATNNCNDKKFTYSLEAIYKGWVDELTYAPTKPGVGLAMYVRTRHIGTSKLDFKPEEYNHPNLIKLLGYCLNKQELSCVYELTPDTSLDELLFGGTTSLSWVARLKIAVGAAEGLSFLHKKGHQAYNQFKTACILVDTDYNARLRDFELEDSFDVRGNANRNEGKGKFG